MKLKGDARKTALEAGAKQEGTVELYTGLIVQEGGGTIKTAFEKAYPGVKLDLIRLTGSVMTTRTAQEYQAGKYLVDAFEGSTTSVPPLREAGVLHPFAVASADDYPAGLKDANGMWNATRVQIIELSYNKKLINESDLPDTIEAMANMDPRKWKGQIGLDGGDYSGGPLFVASVLDIYGEQKGTDILKKMAPLTTPFKDSTKALMDKTAAGDLAMCVCYAHHTEASKRDGAPVDWLPWKPTPVISGSVALAKNPPHPHAALLFADWLTSADGGQLAYQAANYVPAHPKVASVPPLLKTRVTDARYLDVNALASGEKKATQLYHDIFEK